MTLSDSDHIHAYLAAELIGAALGAEVALIFLASDFPACDPHHGLRLQGVWKPANSTSINRYLCPADGPISWCATHGEPVIIEGPLLELLRVELGDILTNSSCLVLTPLIHEPTSEFHRTSLREDNITNHRGVKSFSSQSHSPTVVGVLGVGFDSQDLADMVNGADAFRRSMVARCQSLSTIATRLMITISQLSQGSDSFESGIDNFSSSTAALAEVLGADSIELRRIAIVRMSAWQTALSPYEQAEHFDRIIRLVRSILPPHFPLYVGPDGDILIAFDKMMTDLLLKRITELFSNLRTSCPAIELSEIARVDLAEYSAHLEEEESVPLSLTRENNDSKPKAPQFSGYRLLDSAPTYLAERKHKGPLRLAIRKAVDNLCPNSARPSTATSQLNKSQRRKTKSLPA